MSDLNERLLDRWIRLSLAITNRRMVSELPYNEALICNILYRQQRHAPETLLTATDLCRATRMLKSQMNKTLTQLEEKGLITRQRCQQDKRQWFITLNMEEGGAYQRQHRETLGIVDSIVDKMGPEKAEEVLSILDAVAQAAEEALQ